MGGTTVVQVLIALLCVVRYVMKKVFFNAIE